MWDSLTKAPFPEHFEDYAHLVGKIVQDDEFSNIKYIQVWNEMKGFWNHGENRWDYEGYTDLYNHIWDTVKAVRPDIRIGGPYVVIGAYGGPSSNRAAVDYPWGAFDQRDLDVITYWLQHKRGADFIAVDGKIKNNRDFIHPVGPFERTQKFVNFTDWLRGLDPNVYPDAASLPLWWAEWYTVPQNSNISQTEKNALMATGLIRTLKSGAATALIWKPQGDANGNGFPLALFTDTENSGSNGGQATLFHTTQQYIHDYFSAGTALQDISSGNTQVEILSSYDKTLLVNRTNSSQTAVVRNQNETLSAFEVRLIDTPPLCNLLSNGNFDNDLDDWNYWDCAANIIAGECDISNIQLSNNRPWDVVVMQANLALSPGQAYEISFKASADANRSLKVKIGEGAPPWTNYAYPLFNLGTTSQIFTHSFTMNSSGSSNARIEFQMGANSTGLKFDDVVLKKIECCPLAGTACNDNDPNTLNDLADGNCGCAGTCSMLDNGSFENGLNGWDFWQCDATTINNTACRIDNISLESANPWNAILAYPDLTIEQGKQYRLTFQAASLNPARNLKVKIGKGASPYTNYHGKTFNLTDKLNTFSTTFTMNAASSTIGRLEFQVGGIYTGLILDNVSLGEVGCGNARRAKSRTPEFQLYPNPSTERINLHYDWPESDEADIIVYNAIGHRVKQINVQLLAGSQTLDFNVADLPTGIYFCLLKGSTWQSVQRFVVARR